MRLDATFRGHEGRVGEDHVGDIRSNVLRGERVVFVDVRIGETVKVHIHQRQPHHVWRDVVALKVLREAALSRRE